MALRILNFVSENNPIAGSDSHQTIKMDDTSTSSGPAKLNQLLRFALIILFGSCGVWLFLHGLSMFDTGHTSFPWGTAWTWAQPIEAVFYRIAVGVWVGVYLSAIYGTVGMVILDILNSVFYLLACVLLLRNKLSGTFMAAGISLVSALISAVGILVGEAHAIRATGRIAFTWDMVVLVEYGILTYVLTSSLVERQKELADH